MRKPGAICLLVVLISTTTVAAQDVGDRLPPLHVTDWIHGSQEDVGEWGDGRVYVLELWGTWCAPCIEVIPHLTRLQKEYREEGLVVVGYTWESAGIVRAFRDRMGETMDYVVVTDTSEVTIGKLSEAEAVEGFPYSFLVDRSGTIVWKGNSKQLPAVIDRFFE